MPYFGVPIRNGVPIGLGSIAGFGISPFDPSQLFAGGEQGGWYDPSDLTTMFQDAAGTTPVTAVEQPVGLVLDKSKGLVLGSELWAGFGTITSPWTSVGGGVFSINGSQGANADLSENLQFSSGKTYLVSFTLSGVSGGTLSVFVGEGSGRSLGNGTYTYRQLASQAYLIFRAPAGVSATVSNISVRELPGNHLSQSTSTARPVLSARVNLLTQTEAFDNAAWNKPNATVTANQAASPIGTSTADRLSEKTATATPNVFQVASTNPAGTYAYSCAVKKDTQRYAIVSFAQSGGAYTAACIDLDNGTITKSGVSTGVTAPAVPTSVSLGGGWYRVTVYGTTTAILNSVAVQPSDTGNPTFGAFGDYSYAGNSSNAIYIWGADLRPANAGVGLPSYQRVTTATDYDASGFPYYLRFDGTDDFLLSGTIDPGSVDKAQVFAGVRKLSDAAIGTIMEMSTNSGNINGTLMLTHSGQTSAGAKYGSTLRGSSLIYSETAASYAAPLTSVVSLISDIGQSTAATEQTMRINGAAASLTTVGADAGTGNFSSQVLYVGSRAGNSVRLNGYLYSLILRFSATNMDAATISSTETWVNQKTLAY